MIAIHPFQSNYADMPSIGSYDSNEEAETARQELEEQLELHGGPQCETKESWNLAYEAALKVTHSLYPPNSAIKTITVPSTPPANAGIKTQSGDGIYVESLEDGRFRLDVSWRLLLSKKKFFVGTFEHRASAVAAGFWVRSKLDALTNNYNTTEAKEAFSRVKEKLRTLCKAGELIYALDPVIVDDYPPVVTESLLYKAAGKEPADYYRSEVHPRPNLSSLSRQEAALLCVKREEALKETEQRLREVDPFADDAIEADKRLNRDFVELQYQVNLLGLRSAYPELSFTQEEIEETCSYLMENWVDLDGTTLRIIDGKRVRSIEADERQVRKVVWVYRGETVYLDDDGNPKLPQDGPQTRYRVKAHIFRMFQLHAGKLPTRTGQHVSHYGANRHNVKDAQFEPDYINWWLRKNCEVAGKCSCGLTPECAIVCQNEDYVANRRTPLKSLPVSLGDDHDDQDNDDESILAAERLSPSGESEEEQDDDGGHSNSRISVSANRPAHDVDNEPGYY